MNLRKEQLQMFGPACHCSSLRDAIDLIRAHPGSPDTRRKAAACGMALHAAQAVRETDHFEDGRFVVDQISRAKSEIDIASFHFGDVAPVTSAILIAAQRFLDQNTIGCHEWPTPEEIADIVIRAAMAESAA